MKCTTIENNKKIKTWDLVTYKSYLTSLEVGLVQSIDNNDEVYILWLTSNNYSNVEMDSIKKFEGKITLEND